LRQELQGDPQNPNVSTALAFALLQTSQKAEARQVLESTVTAHPEHAEAQYELGKLLLEQGDLQGSVSHLKQAEAVDGTKDYVHYQLGSAYKRSGLTADAEREFKIYRQLKDQNRNAHAVPQ
jgi:Flp pilus assembly protein TadD